MRKKCGAILFCCLISFLGMAQERLDWSKTRILTEDLPPLSYLDKKTGKLSGTSAKLVQDALDRLKISVEIEVLPWARALKYAQTDADVFIFNLARTEEREKSFQ